MSIVVNKEALQIFLVGMLRPLVRFCLRNHLKIQEVTEALKLVFIEEARAESERRGEKFNTSRASVSTGINRRDVDRIIEDKPKVNTGIVGRVLGLWLHGNAYKDKAGNPKILSCTSEESDFHQLVRRFSSDVHPRSVLAELKRAELVDEQDGFLRLVGKIYTPKGDCRSGVNILSDDLHDLICVVEDNVMKFGAHHSKIEHHHLRTEFDAIPSNKLEKVREFIAKKGEKIHSEVASYLAKLDLDVKSSGRKLSNSKDDMPKEDLVRVVFSSFSITDKVISEQDSRKEK